MHCTHQADLPFVGSSHLSALPGKGPGPHRHPYDEVQFIREGRGLYNLDGTEFEAGAGEIQRFIQEDL